MLTYFRTFGPGGELIFLFTVLCIDALLVPTLPELFVMGFYASNPTPMWGLTLLGVVIAAEISGNGILYLAVRRFGLPEFLESRMRRWVQFLVVHDERIILVNRVAPIIPFVGAFIATQKWDVRRSFFYIFIGGAVKYTLLIGFVSIFFLYFEAKTARNVTLVAIAALIAVSLVQGHMARKRHLGPVATKVAHLGEHGAHASTAGKPDGEATAAPSTPSTPPKEQGPDAKSK